MTTFHKPTRNNSGKRVAYVNARLMDRVAVRQAVLELLLASK